eukprot:285579-Chlamydomonas_euryale.AAC.1
MEPAAVGRGCREVRGVAFGTEASGGLVQAALRRLSCATRGWEGGGAAGPVAGSLGWAGSVSASL